MFNFKILSVAIVVLSCSFIAAQEEIPPTPVVPEILEIPEIPEIEIPEIEIAEIVIPPEFYFYSDFDINPEFDFSFEGVPFAQAPEFSEESPEPTTPPDKPGKMQEKVESLRVWKLLETLDLTEEQANSFLPAYREFQKSEGKYTQTRRELLDQLQEALEDKDQKKISDLVAKLKQNRLQMEQDRVQFLAKLDKLLTPEQQAKFLLFQHQFEGRMRSEIWQLRQPQVYKNIQKPFLELELKNLNDKMQKLHKKNLKEDDLEELKARLEESHQKAQEMYKRSEEMYQELMKKFNEMEKKEKSKKTY